MSAYCREDGTCRTWTSPHEQSGDQSQHAWYAGVEPDCSVDQRGTWKRVSSSNRSCRSQVASATALATARYSASALERDTVASRFYDQEMRLSPRRSSSSTQKLKLMGRDGNSLIFQHSLSRGGSLKPQTWNRSEQQLFYLIALTRIRTLRPLALIP